MKRLAAREPLRHPSDMSSTALQCGSRCRLLEPHPDSPTLFRVRLVRSSYRRLCLASTLGFNLGMTRLALDLIVVLQGAKGLIWADDYLIAFVEPGLDFNLLIAFDSRGDRSEVPAPVLTEYENPLDFFLASRTGRRLLRRLLVLWRLARNDRLQRHGQRVIDRSGGNHCRRRHARPKFVAHLLNRVQLDLDDEILGFLRVRIRSDRLPGPSNGGRAFLDYLAFDFDLAQRVDFNLGLLANLNVSDVGFINLDLGVDLRHVSHSHQRRG